METNLRGVSEILAHGLEEAGLRMQARDLVFVLDRQQFEVALRRSFRDVFAVDRGTFRIPDVCNELLVLLRERFILIADEEFAAASDHAIKRLGDLAAAVDDRGYVVRLFRGNAAPRKGPLVVVDAHAVQFDCSIQRVARYRQQAALPRVAQHHDVGEDRVAHQSARVAIGVDAAHARHCLVDLCQSDVRPEIRIAVLHEIASRHLGGINDGVRALGVVGDRGFRRRGDHEVTANECIGARLLDAYLIDVCRFVG